MSSPGSTSKTEHASTPPARRVFVGLTGASGHAYGRALLVALTEAHYSVDLALSSAGAKVLLHEQGVATLEDGRIAPQVLSRWLGEKAASNIRVWGREDVGAPPASGTAQGAAVIICPCSMGTLARVAAGFSSNLVERAADVAIKERRRLILVPREAPLSEIHLENMLRLSRLGATIVPASPGFYHLPTSLDDLVEHLVSKILDAAGIERVSAIRWAGLPTEPPAEPGTTREEPS
jgi:flavin prenyltransferase